MVHIKRHVVISCKAVHPLQAWFMLPGVSIRWETQLILEGILPVGRQPEIAEL